MRVLFFIALAAAIAWTAFVIFANGMKPSETGPFIGKESLVWAWLVVAVLAAGTVFG